ncbi:MAG: complex I subunit 4 family protein [Candidatus Asgardarchaeia archaeon]
MILIASLIMLFVSALSSYIVGKKSGKLAGLVSALSFLAFLLLILYNTSLMKVPIEEHYTWISPLLNIDFGLRFDNLSGPVASIILFLGLLVSIYSIDYMADHENIGLYFLNLDLFILGMYGFVLSTNLLELFLFFEFMLIPSYILVAKWGTPEYRLRAAFRFFIYAEAGGILVLLAIAGSWMYSNPHTFEISLLNFSSAPSNLVTLIALLFVLGFGFKMAIVPFHNWLPLTYSEAPTPISVLLSGIMTECGMYAVVRIVYLHMAEYLASLSYPLLILGIITTLYGAIMALSQDDLKRLLAFSSISQMGYMFVGFSTLRTLGVVGAIFHVITHSFAKPLLFMTAGVLMKVIGHEKGRSINELHGLAPKMPITATLTLIAGLSIAGTPPLGGFSSEWILFESVVQSGDLLTAIVFASSSILSAAYILWFYKRVFFGPESEEFDDVKDPSLYMVFPMATLAFMIVLFGLFPGYILEILSMGLEV